MAGAAGPPEPRPKGRPRVEAELGRPYLAVVERAEELHRQHRLSWAAIAELLGYHRATLQRYRQRYHAERG